MSRDIEHRHAPAGKALKYALPECERRFLLPCLPDQAIARSVAITDRYLTGTRVRLRRMVETVEGRTTMFFKLTQKIPAPDGAPGLLTTMYLSEAEYRVF